MLHWNAKIKSLEVEDNYRENLIKMQDIELSSVHWFKGNYVFVGK